MALTHLLETSVLTRLGDPEERASLDRIHEGYRELRKQLKAEGFDGTEEYEKLRARFGVSSA